MKVFTHKDIEELFPKAQLRTFASNQIVVYEGDTPQYIHYVKSGALKNYDIDTYGNEKVLHVIGDKGFFSIMYVFGGNQQIHNFYSTLCESELYLIPVEDFKNALHSNIRFSNDIFEWFCHEIAHIMGRIQGLEKSEGKYKVTYALNYLMNRHSFHASKDWCEVKFPITQQFLSDLVGLTRETVSTIIKELDDKKVINYPKQSCLHININKLNKINSK